MQTPSPRALRERVSNRAAGLLKRPSGQNADPTTPAPAAPAAAKAPAAPPQEVTLLEGLLRGDDLTTSVLTQVREWVADGDVESAVSLTESLRRHEQSREVGDLASGVLAFHRGLLELAWARFTSLPRAAWATYAPEEYTRCGLETARQQTVEELRDVAAHDSSAVTLRDWVTIVGVVFGAGEQALAGELFDVVEATAAQLPADADRVERNRAWLEPWVRAGIDRTAPARRAPGVRRRRLRAPRHEPRLGQHRRPRAEHRLARPPRPAPLRAAARRGRPRRPAGPARRAHPARTARWTAWTPTST